MDDKTAEEILSALDMLTETVARLARSLDESERAAERRAFAVEAALHRISERVDAVAGKDVQPRPAQAKREASPEDLLSGLKGMGALTSRLSRPSDVERDGA